MERDALDFGKTNVTRLFIKLFVPTLLGLLFGALFNLADGIFVGRGVGSDALAAVNIAAPPFLLATGLALMFGSGVSVVAAIHLSHGNKKAASINVTQALTASVTLMSIVSLFIFIFPEPTARLFGGNDRLMSLVLDYMLWILPALLGCMVTFIGMFVIRLDGSPKYAMMCEIVPSIINIILDYVCIFPLAMGIKGAAIATSTAQMQQFINQGLQPEPLHCGSVQYPCRQMMMEHDDESHRYERITEICDAFNKTFSSSTELNALT